MLLRRMRKAYRMVAKNGAGDACLIGWRFGEFASEYTHRVRGFRNCFVALLLCSSRTETQTKSIVVLTVVIPVTARHDCHMVNMVDILLQYFVVEVSTRLCHHPDHIQEWRY